MNDDKNTKEIKFTSIGDLTPSDALVFYKGKDKIAYIEHHSITPNGLSIGKPVKNATVEKMVSKFGVKKGRSKNGQFTDLYCDSVIPDNLISLHPTYCIFTQKPEVKEIFVHKRRAKLSNSSEYYYSN